MPPFLPPLSLERTNPSGERNMTGEPIALPKPYGEFDLAGHHFACYLPTSSAGPVAWTVLITLEGVEIRRETIPMFYAPTFGPDAGDVAAMNARVEEIIGELGLEG